MNDTTSRPDGSQHEPPPPPPRRALGSVGDVRRSRDDRVLAGVCGGVARHFDVDPVVVRVVTVVLCFVGLAGVILYVAAWLFLPGDGEPRSNVGEWFGLDEREQQVREIGLVTAAVLAVVAVVGDGGWGAGPEWLFWVAFWVAVPVAVVTWLVRRARRGRPTAPDDVVPTTGGASDGPAGPDRTTSSAAAVHPPAHDVPATPPAGSTISPAAPQPPLPPASPTPVSPPPAPRRPREPFTWVPTLLALSVVAIAGAVLRLTTEPDRTTYVAVALGVVGLALVLSTFTRGGAPLVLLGLVLTAALAVGTLLPSTRAGDREVVPASAAQLEPRYEHGFGRFTLDLRGLDEDDLVGRDVTIDTGLGDTVVIVPEGVPVTAEICTRAGDLDLLGERTSGVQQCLEQPGTGPALTIDVQHTAGRVEVTTR